MHLVRMIISVTILAIIFAFTSGLPKPNKNRNVGAIYDVIDHIQIHSPGRTKRSSTEYFPRDLRVNFKSKGEDVLLRLKRAERVDVPVYLADNGKVEETDIDHDSMSTIYHDVTSGVPILVKVSGTGENFGHLYTLEGNLVLKSQNLGISTNDFGQHVLRDIKNFDFGNDEIFVKGREMKDRKSIKEMRNILKKRTKSQSKDLTVFTVELLMVADVSVKDRFMALYRKEDALGVLKTYFELIAYSVQERFESIADFYSDTEVKIELSGIVIMNSTDDAPFCRDNIRKGYLQFDRALDDFAMWSYETEDLPPHDHAMWITDEILAEGRDTSTNGVSFIGMACTDKKVSLVEDYYTGRTGHIAAHELGHNLNAIHDTGHRKKNCYNGLGYIMTPFSYFPRSAKRRSRPFQFSECSMDEIVFYLYTDEDSTCLLEDDNGFTREMKPHRAGESFNADIQCRMAMDDQNSFFCRYEQSLDSIDNMCINLHCYDPEEDECVSGYIAFDYTVCGDKKWCVEGQCVEDDEAPSQSENCPQGELVVARCDVRDCSSYTIHEKADCCEQCRYEIPNHVCDTERNRYKCYWCHERPRRMRRRECDRYRSD